MNALEALKAMYEGKTVVLKKSLYVTYALHHLRDGSMCRISHYENTSPCIGHSIELDLNGEYELVEDQCTNN